MISYPSRRDRKSGFTLIELLAVVSIMALIIALVAPAFNSIGKASSLTNGANMVMDQMNLARQSALAQSRLVEMRFYYLPGPADGTTATAYRAVRTFVYDATGSKATPMSGVKSLPSGIIMVSGSTFSTLLVAGQGGNAPTTGTENLPSMSNVTYMAFQFRPSGSTNLNPNGASGGDKWFVSFKTETDRAPNNTRPAVNFITAQLDPVSGRVRVFRP